MALIDDLVSYWSLDEASGNAIDAHAANDLTDTNTVGSATGKVGNARDFEDGSSEYLTRASNSELQTGDIDYTFALWLQLESKGANRIPVSKISGPTPEIFEYKLEYEPGPDRFKFYVADGASTMVGTATADTLGSPSTATWYFIVFWHDAAANTVNIQVNNGSVDSSATTGTPGVGAAPFILGRQDYSPFFQYFDGLIDEVGLWKRILTSDERTELYNGGAGRDYAYIAGGGGGSVIPALDQGMLIGGLSTLCGGLA